MVPYILTGQNESFPRHDYKFMARRGSQTFNQPLMEDNNGFKDLLPTPGGNRV